MMSNNLLSDNYDYRFKIIVIGDENVGKTSFVSKLVNNDFTKSYISTIGVDFLVHLVNDGLHISKLQIWDTAGQEKFRAITNFYYKKSQGVIMVFDLNKKSTFDSLNYWLTQVKQNIIEPPFIILIGNKKDLSRQVSSKDIKYFCKTNNIHYYEISLVNIKKNELDKIIQQFAKGLKSTNVSNKEASLKLVDVKKDYCCF